VKDQEIRRQENRHGKGDQETFRRRIYLHIFFNATRKWRKTSRFTGIW
jgi:hypothetical protein